MRHHCLLLYCVTGLRFRKEVWKHLLWYKNTMHVPYVFFCCVLNHYISFRIAKLEPQTVTQPLSHTDQRQEKQFSSRTNYTVPCLGMDLVILIFFCACSLCLYCEDLEIEWEREAGGGEEKKKQVWPKFSQLSPRCLTEVIVSDRSSSHEPWTEKGWN